MYFELKFLQKLPIYDEVQPYKLHGFPHVDEAQQTNCVYEHVNRIEAQDVRSCHDKPRLEQEGFEFIDSPSRCTLSADVFEQDTKEMDQVLRDFLQETMDLVKLRLAAESVVTIDWRFRRNASAAYPQRLEAGDVRKMAIAVATTMHCDFSYLGGYERLQMHLTKDEMSSIDKGEVKAMIINVWGPLKPVSSAPLVLADRRSVSKKDVVEVDQVMPDKVNRTSLVYHRPEQKWFWMSSQTPDEIIMFTTWTAATEDEHSDFSPHSAAYLHQSEVDGPPRESVEVRMIVLIR